MKIAALIDRAALAVLLALVGSVAAGPPPAGQVLPVAVERGQCEFVLPAGQPGDQYWLIVGSLAREPGPFPIAVTSTAAAGEACLPACPSEDSLLARTRRRRQADRLELARRQPVFEMAIAQLRPPAAKRTFHLFIKRNEFDDPSSYVAVQADLEGCGQHCQVYVEKEVPRTQRLQDAVDDVVRTFDREVYPRARRLGHALDVDRDGRFTILFSSWLDKLCDGSVSIGGFVRGSDFYRDLAAPFGNRCDMMFLNANLEAGPHLRTLLAHEYTHAVVFSEHVFAGYLPEEKPREEEAWINEAIAHLIEEEHGHGWSNLDYRVSAFLNDPARYRLVVADYYSEGLWRSHGNRGGTFLFLRWCLARGGADLLTRLTRSSLSGSENLEVAMGDSFTELFRAWTAALVLDDESLTRGQLGARRLCGPRFESLQLAGDRRALSLAGTSACYLLLHSPAASGTRVRIEASAAACLQVSLVRVPADTPRLEAKLTHDDKGGCQLSLTAHGGNIQLCGLVCERTVPAARRDEDTTGSNDAAARGQLHTHFGTSVLRAGETRTSVWTTPPDLADPDAVIKVWGKDAAGRPIVAWAQPER